MIPHISSHRNENPLGPSPKASDVIASLSRRVHRYPDMRADKLQQHIARKYEVSPDQVVLGNGSAALLKLLIDITCAPDSDDEVLSFTPEFALVRHLADVRRVNHVAVGARRSTIFDVRQLIAAANEKTRICLLSSPHNPTGTYFNTEDILTLIRQLPPHILLVVDEAYAEFATATDFPNAISLHHLRKNMVVLRTFSKAYALAGLRVGYLIGNRSITSVLGHETLPYNINALAQAAAVAALDDERHLALTVAKNAQERLYLQNALRELGVHVWESQGNFLFIEMGHNTQAFYRALVERGIEVAYIPEIPGLRVSVNARPDNNAFLDGISDLLEQLPTGTLPMDPAIRDVINIGKLIEQGECLRAGRLLQRIEQNSDLRENASGRLALAFAKGLNSRVTRRDAKAANLYCQSDMIKAFQVLLQQTPLIRHGHLGSLAAIVKALGSARRIHIVDIGIGQGTQWYDLFGMLDRLRTEHVHLTGIDLPMEKDAPQERIGAPLAEAARKSGIEFKYTHIAQQVEAVDMQAIDIRADEVLAVSAAFALHHLSDEDKRAVVGQIARLNPYITTVIEPDSEHESLPFLPRLREAIGHYGTVFDVLSTLLLDGPEREIIEDAFFCREIVDVIGRPGTDRYERHRRSYYWQWGLFGQAMRPFDMGHCVSDVKGILGLLHPDFEMKQTGNTFHLSWKGFPLVATSAWTCGASEGRS